MRITPFYLYLVLAFVLVYFCDGMPPKNTVFIRFTKEEHKLMFEMLESHARSGEYKASVWRDIQKAIGEKVKAKVEGFPRYREIRSLQQHFGTTLNNDKIQVSDALRQLYHQMRRSAITRQEQDFINTELLKSDGDSRTLFNTRKWINMQKKHERKREAGDLGFAIQRSWDALRSHFRNVMMPKNFVHEAVKRKYPEYFEPTEGVSSINKMNRSEAGPSDSKFTLYSDQEHELMFKMLETQADSYHASVWDEIERVFEKKRKAKAAGFVTPRNIKSIKQHFYNILKGDKVQIPAVVRAVAEKMKRICITPQEQDLINRELARTDLPAWTLDTNERWKKMQEKHDEKRRSGTPGFAHKRSEITLRNHLFSVMKAKNLVSEDVKKRFPQDFEINQGARTFEERGQSDNDPGEDMECDGDIWDPILEDLEKLQQGPVDEYGIDHSMFLDPIDDNGLYMDDSPYDYRTFDPMSP